MYKFEFTVIVWMALVVGPVSAFRRRFGIFSAAVTAGNGSQHDEEHEEPAPNSSSSSAWLDGFGLDEDDDLLASKEDEEDTELLDALKLHPLLQIPNLLALTGVLQATETPVRTFLDTGAMRTVMSWDMAGRLGVLQHLDRRYSGQAAGIGSCRVLGRLPAGLFAMHLGSEVTVSSPAITILESTGLPGVELLLGLDFLREYQAVLDMRLEEIRVVVGKQEHAVPFMRPRGDFPEKEEEYDWDGKKTKFHYDTAELYDDRYLDQETYQDEEDWPDMSGV